MHRMEIFWDELVVAFSSNENDVMYYLDKLSGEVFSVNEYNRSSYNDFDRFVEIPKFDYFNERELINLLLKKSDNKEFKEVISKLQNKYTGKIEEILSFYPEENENFIALKEEFISGRVKSWLEINNLQPVLSKL